MQNYFVTGATSGIGLDVCEAILKKKHRVLAIGRNAAALSDLMHTYSGDQLVFKSFDLTDLEGIEPLINNLCENHGKLDGLVLCAGVEETLPLSLYKTKKIQSIFNINVFSNIEILRVFSKNKLSNNGASAVLISSVMAELGQAGKVGYCATKAAILGIIKAAALELSARKIRINAIAPAVVNTPMTDKLLSNLSPESIQAIKEMHPGGFGETQDIVPLIMFLLSDGAKWITGQNIKIDGGYSIR